MKAAKSQMELSDLLVVAVHYQHPKATEFVLASYDRARFKKNTSHYWYYYLIPHLPKSSLSQLEELVPKIKGNDADAFVRAIEELRSKP